jgi:hypothetical protein
MSADALSRVKVILLFAQHASAASPSAGVPGQSGSLHPDGGALRGCDLPEARTPAGGAEVAPTARQGVPCSLHCSCGTAAGNVFCVQGYVDICCVEQSSWCHTCAAGPCRADESKQGRAGRPGRRPWPCPGQVDSCSPKRGVQAEPVRCRWVCRNKCPTQFISCHPTAAVLLHDAPVVRPCCLPRIIHAIPCTVMFSAFNIVQKQVE